MANEKKVTVRVLAQLPLQGRDYKPNTLLELDAEEAAALKKSGSVDDSAAAVDYCKKELKAKVIKHTPGADNTVENEE